MRFFFNVLTFRDVSPSHIQQQELFHEGSGILALVTPVGSSQMLLREPFEYGKNKKISIVYSLVIVLSLWWWWCNLIAHPPPSTPPPSTNSSPPKGCFPNCLEKKVYWIQRWAAADYNRCSGLLLAGSSAMPGKVIHGLFIPLSFVLQQNFPKYSVSYEFSFFNLLSLYL